MTEEPASVDDEREAIAAAFDSATDPLAQYAPTFEALDTDPFRLFFRAVLASQDAAAKTWAKYDRLVSQWRTHMARAGRHPACPSDEHVRGFVTYLTDERDNQPNTVRLKLQRLRKIYAYWQQDPALPHPTDYDPFSLVLSTVDFSEPPSKEPPRLPPEKLRAVVQSITDLREQAIVVTQLKLGVRASELANMQLRDLHLDCPVLQDAYPALGSHDRLADRTNAVYIPTRRERTKNKSRRPRVLPVDAELRDLLVRYLLTRPDTGADAVFLTGVTHNPLNQEYINRTWTEHFHPEYAETDQHRAVTSHYGRHRFTTYWQVEVGLHRELVKYMRGDAVDGDHPNREGIDHYLHTYYEDIADRYREEMFELLP